MNKISKKLSLVSCLLALVLSIVGCGAKGPDYDPQMVGQAAKGMITVLSSVNPLYYDQVAAFNEDDLDEVVAMYKQQGLNMEPAAFSDGFASYMNSLTTLGEVVKISDVEKIDYSNGEITAHIAITGSETYPNGQPRTADAEVVMDKNYKVKSAAVNINQTTSEKLSHAGLNTLLGMGTTFTVLILISLVIYLLSFVPKMISGEGKKKAAEESTSTGNKALDQIAQKEDAAKAEADNTALIAVISAAIAAYESEATGRVVTPDTFVVRSLKKH
ncbi:MAG: OadG family protein [Lachnospiraceae bacterium]|nr:OadG family protein [Lachnospiraceae bacterium]